MRYAEQPIVPQLESEVIARVRAISSVRERQENVFAKMGGSSIESRAFLHCFSVERNIDLAEYDSLRPAIEYFREGRAPRRSPFARVSLAARVGWSLRQGLAGRPSHALQEVRAINPRYALAFFGGNDVQGRNPRRFAERLEQLVESLVQRGVVPILGATTPRGDDPEMDEWARRYNRVSRGLAMAWQLPYVDFYTALNELPNHGLAGDGVHPNVMMDGARGRPCVFDEQGLRYGANQRNLRTLQTLDGLWRASQAPAEAPAPRVGEGTPSSPLRLTQIPFGERLQPGTLSSELDGYACNEAEPAPGPERVYRLLIDETRPIELNVFGEGGARIFVLGESPDPASCVGGGRQDVKYVFEPGVHHIVVEVDESSEGSISLVVDTPID